MGGKKYTKSNKLVEIKHANLIASTKPESEPGWIHLTY